MDDDDEVKRKTISQFAFLPRTFRVLFFPALPSSPEKHPSEQRASESLHLSLFSQHHWSCFFPFPPPSPPSRLIRSRASGNRSKEKKEPKAADVVVLL